MGELEEKSDLTIWLILLFKNTLQTPLEGRELCQSEVSERRF